MTAEDSITDPLLLSVLQAAAEARNQSLAILALINDHHASPSPEPPTDNTLQHISKQQKLLHTHLVRLRGLNRQATLAVRTTKQATAEARHEIDTLHLELQNLYYEQRHLRGEIAACESYSHPHEQISLIDVEDFLTLHPEFRSASEHDVTVARIRDEHAQRVALEEQRLALVRRKEALVKETAGKKEELARLDGEMEKWVHGQEAVRKLLEAGEKKSREATASTE
ncbi:Fms-interacting protein-domain-containing protein [Neohortaea acidophila]|uniref:Fms-interacting protein-domain-containing protein n=1 Tax=Neohortaea acidophila TaxID=245834 RepID=A0A6A6PP73_9PEZI|nr:Fms-interacting protein-domain-containing protein [Neohortaea acidophila]KAF2481057.1 Fms-interacting protein-domain-containing protein [Neohortaea acidophila]